MQIDLSGLAKGWAAQQAADRLSKIGACLVDVGGAIVARGAPDDSGGWLVSIHKPDRPGILYTLLLTDSAVATSGADYRHWIRDSKLYQLKDSHVGRSGNSDILSATVVAPDAIQAETWANAARISGKLPQFPTVLVRQGGSVVCNPEIESLCILNVQ
jgi:thiamine biosynthesis lipoprotein